jgi:hypothetical protein
MSPVNPPRLALLLLDWFLPGNEELVGDLVERFAVKRSRLWVWRETVLALATAIGQPRGEVRPLKLVRDARWMNAGRPERRTGARPINLTASPIPGIGGLGLAALGVDVALARPGAVLVLLPAIPLGVALGLAMTFVRRRGLAADARARMLS